MNQEILQTIQKKYGKQNIPELKAGDTIRVFEKIKEKNKDRVQIFEGLVIARKHGKSLDGSFTVRKVTTGGFGVEKIFPLHSPNVIKIERLKSAKVNRAKLYYMRERFGRGARFKKETATHKVWEEKDAEEVLEQIAEETAEAAEQTAEEKKDA